ncbi:MAG: glycosyltransferase family 1 protein [Alcaligenaceae bacterium]
MFKSLAKYIYDLMTTGAPRKALKAFITRHPSVDKYIRKVQLALFDGYPVHSRDVRYRTNSTTKVLFVDVSFLVLEDLKTGIQRVTRSVLLQLLKHAPEGYVVQPVYGDHHLGYKPAAMTLTEADELSLAQSLSADPIQISRGDLFLGLNFSCATTLKEQGYLLKLREAGVKVYIVVYDLLPVQFPSYFPTSAKDFHARWLRALVQFDGAICISKAVADDYQAWIQANGLHVSDTFKITHFHLGADLNNSSPSRGLPVDAKLTLDFFRQSPTFLMVGTLEPRKGYRETLEAFTVLWQAKQNINLLIVGNVGWNVDDVIKMIDTHPELNKKLFWLKGVSDEYLEQLYGASVCLIAASEGEGFGLPIIEAAQHGLAVMLRDIPVFREVAGDAAFYFGAIQQADDQSAAPSMAQSIKLWLALYETNQHPQSRGIRYISWQQSVEQLKHSLFAS